MAEGIRLMAAAKELNVGISRIAEHLREKGFKVEPKPTFMLSGEMYEILLNEFQQDKATKEKARKITFGQTTKENIAIPGDTLGISKRQNEQEEIMVKNMGTVGLEPLTEEVEAPRVRAPEPEKAPPPPPPAAEKPKEEPPQKELKKLKIEKLEGPKVVGKIDLPPPAEPRTKRLVASSSEGTGTGKKKKKRKRMLRKGFEPDERRHERPARAEVKEISEKEIQNKIRETLSRLEGGKAKGAKGKYKRLKREAAAEEEKVETTGKQKLQVTEFISVNELASMMNVSVTEVISKCMGLGVFVSMNQRLDAEIIELVSDEFGFDVEFVDLEKKEEMEIPQAAEDPALLSPRAPIVTIMGHVDHGKTSLLDFIRETNVVAGESGGITQHIGAYEVALSSGKSITFLDTPGHEAFTAMRARGAKITDIAVIVIAADDSVMPQTREAISHAQLAGVPMIFAFNKIDKPGANSAKIREQLAGMNLLVEDWGGKYQVQEISAKTGLNVDKLLEKIILEAEMLELKANPGKPAAGSIIEASLEKGRGYVCTALVQEGTMKVGDFLLAGRYFGRIKAMFNERGGRMDSAGPSSPVQVLGLNGAPQAGEKFRITASEQEAREAAVRKEVILREQGFRSKKHITLDEIGRRLVLGTFRELNILIKGDVDGSVEALTDSLQKLSTPEVQVNVIHKSVGAISESDVLLASASDAIIIGFQVRPSLAARQLAEKENIEIRLYSIIYKAIEEIKLAMEGMLEARMEEKITCNIEVREVFKISRVGTVAGCQVKDGKVTRNTKVRVVRDGIVVYTGTLGSLKRFKDDVKEVTSGLECGLTIDKFNDIKAGDIVEGYEVVAVKRTLAG